MRDAEVRFTTAEKAIGTAVSGFHRSGGASSGGGKSGIRDVDHGYDALLKRVFGFGRPVVSSGVLEADGAKAQQPPLRAFREGAPLAAQLGQLFGEGRGERGQKDPVTLIEVACANEFGTESIPERSFIRAWYDESEPKIRGWLRNLMTAVIKGNYTKEQALEILGQMCAASIQERMANVIPPPNAPSTIKAKGSSTPLIDTGQLRSSIHYRVTP